MTTETKKPVSAPTWDKKEKDAIAEYGCELLVENANQEVDRLIKEYKKIKKRQKSNLNQVRLLDKFGNPIKKS